MFSEQNSWTTTNPSNPFPNIYSKFFCFESVFLKNTINFLWLFHSLSLFFMQEVPLRNITSYVERLLFPDSCEKKNANEQKPLKSNMRMKSAAFKARKNNIFFVISQDERFYVFFLVSESIQDQNKTISSLSMRIAKN